MKAHPLACRDNDNLGDELALACNARSMLADTCIISTGIVPVGPQASVGGSRIAEHVAPPLGRASMSAKGWVMRRLVIGLAVAVLGGLAACGSDDQTGLRQDDWATI